MTTVTTEQETLESELSSALERAAEAAISLHSSKEEVCNRLMNKLKVSKLAIEPTENSPAKVFARPMFNPLAGP
jgi:hypothetical protein